MHIYHLIPRAPWMLKLTMSYHTVGVNPRWHKQFYTWFEQSGSWPISIFFSENCFKRIINDQALQIDSEFVYSNVSVLPRAAANLLIITRLWFIPQLNNVVVQRRSVTVANLTCLQRCRDVSWNLAKTELGEFFSTNSVFAKFTTTLEIRLV